jgi:hypothetical protein
MKICWDNLENIVFTRNKTFRMDKKGNGIYCSCLCSSKRLDHPANGNKWNLGKNRPDARKRMLSKDNPSYNKKSALKRSNTIKERGSLNGNRNPNWKGGSTPLALKIRRLPKYIQWRNLIFERDNYTCQICNQRGGSLEAHHIKKFANHPDLWFNIDNGIILCKSCHDNTKGKEKKYENSFNIIIRNKNANKKR